jgi:stage III sporulation protein AH
MLIKKRTALIGVVALLLCVAVYLNWSYRNPSDDKDVEVLSGDSRELAAKTLGEAQLVDGSAGGVQASGLSATETVEYFSEAKLARQKALDEAVGLLKTSAESTDISADARDKAALEIASMASNSLKESKIESLVKAKGFPECLAFISANGISIVVQPEADKALDAAAVAKIKDIAISESAMKPENIKIVEIG